MPESDDFNIPRIDDETERQSYPLDKVMGQGQRRRGKGKQQATSGSQAGRMPPQAHDVEQSVLGAMLIEREAIPKAIEILPPDSFYSVKHLHVYEAILGLFERGNPVDLITLTDELRRRGTLESAGGAYYVTELTTKVASAANVEYHARIIAEKSLLRKLIETMTGLVGTAYDPSTDAFELLDKAEGDIFRISDTQLRKSSASMREVVHETIEKLQSIHGRATGITGVPSGFTRLDAMTGGWQPSDLIIIAARPSMGKCLGKGTPVLMYDGTVRAVEDVKFGDLLMGDDGTPRRVLSLARGREMMYWVRQKHGMDYRVNESHILSLKKSRNDGKGAHGTVTNLNIREYFARSAKWRNDHKGYKVAADFLEQPVPIAPYLLGLWLGDGKSDNARIYTTDEEVVEYLHARADARGAHISVYDAERACPAYLITQGKGGTSKTDSVQAQLRSLGVLGDKHIPQCYLANSKANRLELLAGLIDSDGHLNAGHGGTYEITLTNKVMAEQIKFLCDTLGYRTSIKPKQATIRSRGYSTTAWRVRFNGNVDEIPVRIARKKATPWTDFRDWTMTGITVEADRIDDYYGFEIDGNRLFLLGDCTVTHNTALSLACTRNAALHPQAPAGVAYFSLEMSAQQLAQRLLTSEARVDAQAARTGRLHDEDWPRLARAAGRLAEAPIFIDDTPGLSILELRAKSRRLKAEHDIGLVVVDYLQLMHGTTQNRNGNREQEIAQISRSLKSLAKEINVPVLALSQLSRAVETRGGDKRPQLSDLRESGCLTGDTLVTLAETGQRVPIRDLVGRDGFRIWALNEQTYKLEAATVSKAFSTGIKQTYRLTTRLGRTIRATGNHKFRTFDGWRRLDTIREGEHLALPRTMAQPTQQTMTDAELALLGHLIGDGCTLPRHVVQYTTREHDLAEAVADLTTTIFGEAIAPRINAERDWYQVYLSSTRHHTHGVRNAVAEWLDDIGAWGLRSHEKHVPEAVFQQPAQAVATFLRHLWATDGCVRMRGGKRPYPAVYYASSSKQLAADVQSLLLRFAINARIKRLPQADKGRDQFHVIVSGQEDLLAFAEHIGAAGAYKQASLDEVVAYLKARTANTNRDVIPKAVWRSHVRPAMRRKGVTHRELHAALEMAYSGMTIFKQNISRSRAYRVAEAVDSEALHHLADSDVYWDQVVSIEPDGVEEVFDLTVPGPHNFVANDIIVHNSIEQDADVVMFIYRAERYGFSHDENGRSTEGLGELIIGKQRNGPIGSVEVAFVNQYARFENLTTSYAPVDGGMDMGGDGFGNDSGAMPPQPPLDDAPF